MLNASDPWMEKARQYGQEQLFQFWDRLSAGEQDNLLAQIATIDFEQIHRLFHKSTDEVDWHSLAEKAEPPQAIRLSDAAPPFTAEAAMECGEQAIRAGKVAMILVAGGQGTRLGFDQPKGTFRIGPVSNRSLFAMHADSIRGTSRRYGVSIPMYVMTSPATDLATREYFQEHRNLGLGNDELHVFCQGTMPAVDATTGAILMESTSSLALSPDGHGGIVAALHQQKVLESARQRGIEHFFYAQVDNPLLRACDPLLIGYHLLAQSQMTTQVVSKRFATEKVGNVVAIHGRSHIIEYSDLPEAIANQVHSDGSLKLWAGNIAIHVLDLNFLESSATQNNGLPFHRALKSVPFVDAAGSLVKPSAPNAIKFERFVFDLLPLADRTIVVEGDAKEVFAPVKNADGAATDTPTHCRLALIAQHKRWLEKAGVSVSDLAKVEINPYWALDANEVQQKIQKPAEILVDTYFA
ncbi:MAG: UTP--glucose-1-phosphate uridylyltransferase [Pirellula sp.]